MNKATFVFAVMFFIPVMFCNAGENEDTATKGFYAGAQAATSGFGVNVRYIFNKRLSLKSGIETLSFNKSFNFNEYDISYAANLKYKTGGIFVVADYFYLPGLYVSAGAANNSLNPQLDGEALDGIPYGEITIPPSKVGQFHFSLEPSLKISPYGGIGFRKFFGAGERVAFNFETGIYYLGAPQINIEATGLLAPTANPAHRQKQLLEKQLESYNFYPVVKINLAVKLF